MAVQETEQKIKSGRQICPCHLILNPLHQIWCRSRAAPLARGYYGQAPENCSCFLPLSSLNQILNAFFQKLEPTVWLVKLEQNRGQVRNTFLMSQKSLLLFLPTPSQSCAQHWPNTQLHCYRGEYCSSFSHSKVTRCKASLPQKSTTVWTHNNIQNQEQNILSLSFPVCCIQHFSNFPTLELR